jgi:CelD/BcsL family acetyltransferase involved in cellulose biosynthesis
MATSALGVFARPLGTLSSLDLEVVADTQTGFRKARLRTVGGTTFAPTPDGTCAGQGSLRKQDIGWLLTASSKHRMIERITTLGELAALGEEWNALADRQRNPLLRHEWFVAAAEAFADRERPFILLNRRAGRLVGIAPMSISKDTGTKRLEILGTPSVREPSGLIYADADALGEIIRELPLCGYPINLRRIGVESLEARLIAENSCGSVLRSVRDGASAPYLDYAGPFELERSMSCRRRYDLRRAGRRAKRRGHLTIEAVAATESNVDRLLAETLRVESACYKGKTGTAVFQQPRRHHFYRLYARAAARKGLARFFLVRIDGRAVGALFAVAFAERLWTLKIGYDAAFGWCSPGVLVMHEALRYSFAQGHLGFEFLGFDSPWMRMWTQKKRSFVSPAIYPLSVRGMSGLGRDALRFLVRRARERAALC